MMMVLLCLLCLGSLLLLLLLLLVIAVAVGVLVVLEDGGSPHFVASEWPGTPEPIDLLVPLSDLFLGQAAVHAVSAHHASVGVARAGHRYGIVVSVETKKDFFSTCQKPAGPSCQTMNYPPV
jgi:hypothetical protein